MPFETVWADLRDRCRTLDPDAVLVTPDSERPFDVAAVEDDRIAVRLLDTDEERTLWRDQFDVLYDRLVNGAELSLAGLPVGVEPYAAVLSLAGEFSVDERATVLRHEPTDAESPFLRPEWTARTTPERVRDDAVLLADELRRRDLGDLDSLSAEALGDVYVLLSDVQRGADRLRTDVGDELLEHIGPEGRLHSRYGTVSRTRRERRRLKDEDAVLDALDAAGVPREWVMGVDPEKLDVVLAVTDLAERAVYDVETREFVQKTAVEETEKQTRLQGLRDRLAGIESAEAEELRRDIEAIESRLESVLAAG